MIQNTAMVWLQELQKAEAELVEAGAIHTLDAVVTAASVSLPVRKQLPTCASPALATE